MKRMLRALLLMGTLIGGLFLVVYGVILAQETADPVEPLWVQGSIDPNAPSDLAAFKDAFYASNLSSQSVARDVPAERIKRYRADCVPLPEDLAPDGQNFSVQCWSDIAVAAITEQGWDIFLLQANGANVRRLTDNPASDVNPILNQRATELIFTSNRDGNTEIYRIATNGTSAPVRLTENPASDDWAHWSPDSSQMVFASNRDGDWEIYVMNRDGSGLRQVTYDDASIDTMPIWSPDGNTIAWVKRQGRTGEIWLINSDGANPRKAYGPQPYLGHLRWSRDGGRILFDADMDGDYWNELAVFDGQYASTIYDASTAWQDIWAGAWQPAYDPSTFREDILATRVIYRLEGNQVYLADIRVEAMETYAYGTHPVTSSEVWIGLATNPDWKINDISAPIIAVYPLPPKLTFNSSQRIEVSLIKKDPGNSGISTVEVQYRLDDGEWQALTPDDYHNRFYFQQQDAVGHRVSFIARAVDRAGNWSEWTPDAGANRTILYRGEFHDWIMDFRNRSLPGVTIDAPTLWLDHPTSDFSGNISGQFPLDGLHVLTATTPGYQPVRLEMEVSADDYWFGNRQLKLYPISPLFDDPGFESGQLQGRQTASPSPVSVSSGAAYEGQYGLHISHFDNQPTSIVTASVALTLPEEMNAPYLFFDSKFIVDFVSGDDGDAFAVWITGADGVFKIFQASASEEWVLNALPIEQWSGQAVTLTLEMEQMGSLFNSQMFIDNFYVGNWSTPAITDFALEYHQPMTDVTRSGSITATLTITGENFIRTPTVKIGKTALKEVRFINSERLEATIPANLPSGIHDLWVWNPNGPAAIRPNAIWSGEQLFLPSIHR